MKTNRLKLLCSGLLAAGAALLSPLASHASLFSVDNLFVTNNAYVMGAVGIGTTTPGVDLDIVGSEFRIHNPYSYSDIENISDAATSVLRLIGAGDTYTYDVVQMYDNSGNGWELGYNAVNNGDQMMSMKYFSSSYGFSPDTSWSLIPPTGYGSHDGKMGVGVNSPTEALEVYGNIKTDGCFIGSACGLYVPEQGDLSMGSFTAD